MKLTPDELEYRRKRRALKKRSQELQALATGLVERGYAQMARRFHPDVGGTTEDMVLLGQLRDLLLKGAGAVCLQEGGTLTHFGRTTWLEMRTAFAWTVGVKVNETMSEVMAKTKTKGSK